MILLCVGWYCRYQLSLRDIGEMMRERGIAVDYTTVFRRVQRYAPGINRRMGPHMVVASLLISYLIVFASNFVSTEARGAHGGGFDAPLVETAMAYMISLVMAAGMLWLYQLLEPGASFGQWASYVVVLGLPASVEVVSYQRP